MPRCCASAIEFDALHCHQRFDLVLRGVNATETPRLHFGRSGKLADRFLFLVREGLGAMRGLASFCLLALACKSTSSQDVNGFLVQVSVEPVVVSDDCRPNRFTGDGGVQFFGFQKSGKPVVSSSYEAFWGPARVDGGSIGEGSRQDFVIDEEVNLVQGFDPSRICGRVFYTWSSPGSGPPWVMQLNQRWEAVDLGCSAPGANLPLTACNSTRRFTFTPVSDCALSCVRVRAASDVTCECGR